MINHEAARHFAGPFALVAFPPVLAPLAPKPMMRVYGALIAARTAPKRERKAIRRALVNLPVVRDYVPPTVPVGPDDLPETFLSRLATIGQPGKIVA